MLDVDHFKASTISLRFIRRGLWLCRRWLAHRVVATRVWGLLCAVIRILRTAHGGEESAFSEGDTGEEDGTSRSGFARRIQKRRFFCEQGRWAASTESLAPVCAVLDGRSDARNARSFEGGGGRALYRIERQAGEKSS